MHDCGDSPHLLNDGLPIYVVPRVWGTTVLQGLWYSLSRRCWWAGRWVIKKNWRGWKEERGQYLYIWRRRRRRKKRNRKRRKKGQKGRKEDGREGGKGREGRIIIKIIFRKAFPISHFSEAVILSALLKSQISRGIFKSTCIYKISSVPSSKFRIMGYDAECLTKNPDDGLWKRGEKEEAINFLSSLLMWSRRWGLNTHSQPQRLFWGRKIGQMESGSWTHRDKRSSKETEQRGCWKRSWDCDSHTKGTSKDCCSQHRLV